ncbi:MAG TPA: DUF1573 domain-containing protein [Candidatus Saccharimonadales bacterium]|nr:DUF1573 domain-containing protein [Candidatus Saccharimonadales bacterium]
MKKFWLWTTVIIGIFVLLIVLGKPNGAQTNPSAATGTITTAGSSYDFGTISMKDGRVNYTYTLKNTSDKPVKITKLYTSCMCTTAVLTAGNQKEGPFGMQGHGVAIPNIAVTLAPGEEGKVAIAFDPAAHGPAGVGTINRTIFVVSESNPTLKLKFKATVRP